MFLDRMKSRPGSISDAVLVDVLGGLYGSMVPIAFTAASQAIVGTIAARQTADMAIAIIAGLGVIVDCIRALDVLSFRRQVAATPLRPGADAERYKRRYAGGTAVTAFFLGLSAARGLMLDDAFCAMMAIGLGFGFGAGVVARLSMLPFVALADLGLVAILPIAVAIWRMDAPHVGMALLMAIYLVGSFEMVRLTFNAAIKQIALKHRFEQLSRIDPMTGLLNRSVLATDLARMIAERDGRTVAIHAIDLDHFKAANDRFGHPVGDALIKEVAARLQSLAGDGDLIVRMGGDEFILVQASVRSPSDAERMAQRIFAAVSAPYRIEGHDITIGTSIGVALSGDDGHTAEAMLSRSDKALYAAKADRGGYVFARRLPEARMPTDGDATAHPRAA